MTLNRAVSFKLAGPFAHFRKYYTNATRLTYYIPPRNTIAGTVASILGREKDSYYDEFGRDKIGIAVSPSTKLRKVNFSTNLLNIDSKDLNKLRGIPKGTSSHPTSIELIVSGNWTQRDPEVSYTIYMVSLHGEGGPVEELESALTQGRFKYHVRLGAAFCLGRAELVRSGEAEVLDAQGDAVVDTAVRMDQIESLLNYGKTATIINDLDHPPDLVNKREPSGKGTNIVFSDIGRLKLRLRKGTVFKLGNITGTFI